jgi:hypothetical protein
MGEQLIQTRSLQPGAADLVGKEALAARLLQGIELQSQILISGGDTGIADRQPRVADFADARKGSLDDALLLSILVISVTNRESSFKTDVENRADAEMEMLRPA